MHAKPLDWFVAVCSGCAEGREVLQSCTPVVDDVCGGISIITTTTTPLATEPPIVLAAQSNSKSGLIGGIVGGIFLLLILCVALMMIVARREGQESKDAREFWFEQEELVVCPGFCQMLRLQRLGLTLTLCVFCTLVYVCSLSSSSFVDILFDHHLPAVFPVLHRRSCQTTPRAQARASNV